MTAKGKINASTVTTGDRIIVKIHRNDAGLFTHLTESATKTGEDVIVVRVTGKTFRAAQGQYERQGRYIVMTSAGSFEAAPIQTMWLAPEDPAGIKRAHAEAIELDRTYEAYPLAEPTDEESVRDEARWSLFGSIEDAHTEALALNSLNSEVVDQDEDVISDAPVIENHTGSTVVRLLERVWARIRSDHSELPEVVIITGSGLLGGSKWGHFRADGWKVREEGSALHRHELFLAGEALAKGATQVLQTMLHEAAHTLAKVRGQQDTSRQGRWHNQVFRKTAEEMGLEHRGSQADKTSGFSFVTLTSSTKERYADLLAELDAEIKLTCHLPLWLGGTGAQDEDDERGGEKIGKAPKGEDEGGAKSGPLKAVCGCAEPNIIRASRKVLDLGVVRCDDCDNLFMAA